MTKRFLWTSMAVACLMATLVPAAVQAQVCAPLDNGHMADAFYEGTVIFWDPVVEFQRITLTISGPCEDIVKTFTPKDTLMFDIREIARIVDGEYTWTLRREGSIDPDLQKELQEARFSGEEDDLWWSAFQAGKIPAGPYTDSGSFTVDRGVIIDPGSGEEKRAALSGKGVGNGSSSALQTSVAGGLASGDSGDNPLATKDTVLTNANGVIRNSLCVGFDCANNNTYSDTTILLTENNTRIKFDDTSTINSFPRNDWEIEANSNLNGGASYLGFNDCGQSSGGGCATDLVFAVEAGARQSALYVESDGDVGVGTSNPVVRMHLIDGDTPALRLEQDGSSGFAPQTWDVAGNETTFFIRDATNGSTLPFRIQPGASSNRIFIHSSDNVGFGTTSPDAGIHVLKTGSGVQDMLELEASGTNGRPRFTFSNPSGNWFYEVNGDNFEINRGGSGGPEEMLLEPNGDMTIGGMLTELSSRAAKEGFVELDPADVLARVVDLPVLSWSYTADQQAARHVGPMAEDFYQAFELGDDDRHISPSDKAGVALLAIQGLQQELARRDSRIEELTQQKTALEERMSKLERLVEELAGE